MDTVSKIQEITMRLDQLENTGEWLARALVHKDSSGSQAGSMIIALAEDVREMILDLVTDLEHQATILAEFEEDESLH